MESKQIGWDATMNSYIQPEGVGYDENVEVTFSDMSTDVDIAGTYDWSNDFNNGKYIIAYRILKDVEVKEESPHSHYFKKIAGATEDGYLDIYAVINMFEQKHSGLQHISKKALCAGERGHKNFMNDLEDIRDSAIRAIEMEIAYQKGR
tara:strand:+ start:866 stop:1312 length:447 start_codon:yes stop_codon:yes gene_type:complete